MAIYDELRRGGCILACTYTSPLAQVGQTANSRKSTYQNLDTHEVFASVSAQFRQLLRKDLRRWQGDLASLETMIIAVVRAEQ